MNKRTFILTLGSAMFAVGAGCSENTTKEEVMSKIKNFEELETNETVMSVYRFVDSEANVVLYTGAPNNNGGITAIPLSSTDLEVDNG